MMKCLVKKYAYLICMAIITAVSLFYNGNCPPSFDEAHAWNMARFLSLKEIFEIVKTEGHPFLWYYILMPIAKTNFFYPHSLYLLNLAMILLTVWLLFKYAPLPLWLKCCISISAPIIQMYAVLSRSYTLSILLLFSLLSLYPHRHKKPILYLTLIVLLANTNLIGLFAAFSLGCSYLWESFVFYKKDKEAKPLIITTAFGFLEIALFLWQFYDYDRTIPQHTPISLELIKDINTAFYPLNIPAFILLTLISIGLFIRHKCFKAVSFLIITFSLLIFLFTQIHSGGLHHYSFFYIFLIGAYWLAAMERNINFSPKEYLPIGIIAFLLIFNPYINYKQQNCSYLNMLKTSADNINSLYPQNEKEILVLEPFVAEIILPYLNNNITLLNQSMVDHRSLRAFKEFLYYFFIPIDAHQIAEYIKKSPQLPLYYNCGEDEYNNAVLKFNKIHTLSEIYCLFSITEKTSSDE